MACRYEYNGKEYTRFEILSLIRDGVIAAPLNEQEARNWLKDKLGVPDEQIQVIQGLIDNNSFGRFLEDGTLLLSDELQGAEYHEAFHRVWRTLLTDSERASVTAEFLKRKDARSVLAKKALAYPNASQDVLIEEVLAEEFMFYQLADGKYKVERVTQSLFDRIINFFKRVFGLSIEQLYQNIEAGMYKSRTPVNYTSGSADMVLWNRPIDAVTKQELTSAIAYEMLNAIADHQMLDELVRGQIDMTEVFKDAVQNILLSEEQGGKYALQDIDYELAEAVFEDTFDDELNIKPTAALVQEVTKYLSAVNINLEKELEQKDTDSADNEENIIGDNAFMKISFEFDPMQGVTTKAKLIVASLGAMNSDGTLTRSKKLGLPQVQGYGKAANIIFDVLAGVPNDYEVVYNELANAGVKYPFLFQLLDRLGDPTDVGTDYVQMLRSEFLSSFVKNKYSFVKALFTAEDMKVINLGNESQTERYRQLWKNRLEVSWNSDAELLNSLKGIRTAADVAVMLGMQELVEQDLLLESVDNTTVGAKLLALRSIVVDSLNKGTLRYNLFSKQDDKTIEIEGSVKMLAEVAAIKGVPFDAMLLNGERKRIFAISQHSYQTIVTGALNWISKQSLDNASFEENYAHRLELLKKHAPQLLNVWTYRDGVVLSNWLHKTLSGVQLKIEVFDAVGSRRKTKSTHKVGLADHLALLVNNTYSGRTFSFKHGDRSVMFTYRFQDRSMAVDTISLELERLTEEATDKLQYYIDIDTEVARVTKDSTNPHLGYGTVNVHKNRGKRFLDIDNPRDFIKNQAKNLMQAMKQERLFEQGEKASSPIGVTEEMWKQAMQDNNNDPAKAREAVAMLAASNYFFSYMEEMMLFTSTPNNYKNPVDFFKRIQMQSSTGTAQQTGTALYEYIERLNSADTFDLTDPLTGEGTPIAYGFQGVKRLGYISEVVLESQNYRSGYLDQMMTSKIDGSEVSLPAYVTELGVQRELQNTRPDLTPEQIASIAKAKGQENAKALEEYDENDGSSWINIFYYREHMIASKSWSPRLENTFQIELAVLQNKGDLADTIVYVDPTKENIRAKAEDESWTAVRIFDMTDIAEQLQLSKGGLRWYRKFTDYFTMLKPQYTGPYLPDLQVTEERLNLVAGRKESHAVLVPSVIRGTKLEQMHATMLRTGLDVIHMDSAAKYGRKMFGVFAPVEATRLQDDTGNFNPLIEQYIDSIVSYLDPRYMKNQLDISNKPKDKIRNASQSTKLLLSDMFSDGVPVDVKERELFLEMDEAAKAVMSPIYRAYQNYKTSLHGLLNKTLAELEKEVDDQSLIEVLRQAAINRSEPQYILDSVEHLAKGLELLPNWSRIENILYAIVSNTAISFKRPGDGKPQWSVSLWEPINSNEKPIKGYTFDFDNNGEITKIHPAEVIVPIPPKMISWMLSAAKTTNIVKALDWYEKLTDNKKFVIKSLRIPNQQFSFNDALRIKKFTLPSKQAFIVMPSEVVVKMGADFDIDKQQIYMPVVDRKGRVIRKKATAVERMLQYQRFEKIRYEDDTQVEVDGSLMTVQQAKRLVDDRIKKLEEERSEIIENLGEDFYANYMEDLTVIQDLHSLQNLPVQSMIDALNSRMISASLSGEDIESYTEAIDQINDLIDEYLFDELDTISDTLKEHLQQTKLAAFEQQFPTEELQTHPQVWHNELLAAEIELLLHPANAHRIFASVDDSWFSKDLFATIMAAKHNTTKQEVLANYDKYVLGDLNLANFMSIYGNVTRTLTMLESKANVGLVATNITGHSVWQVDGVKLSENFVIPITGLDINAAPVFGADNRYISEVLSTLLTSQVDGVKNPYAPALGLSSQTLPMVTMLTRFRIPLAVSLAITSNPLVEAYIRAKNTNNSFIISAGSGNKSVRKKTAMLFKQIAGRDRNANIRMNVAEIDVNTRNARILDLFIKLEELADEFFNVQVDMTADTKPIKGRAQLATIKELEITAVDERKYVDGILAPFFKARDSYEKFFSKLYFIDLDQIQTIAKKLASGRESQEELDRLMNNVTNDLLLFVIQNYIFPSVNIEGLLSGHNSVAKRVQKILDEQGTSANYALTQLLPMLNIGEVESRTIDNIRIQERGMTILQMNDMYEAFADLSPDLARDLMLASLYQAGLNTSRFTLREMIQVPYVMQALQKLPELTKQILSNQEQMDHFTTLFIFNNPDLLPDNIWAAAQRKMTYIRVENEKGKTVIQNRVTKQTYEPRGSNYPAVLNYRMKDTALDTTVVESSNRNWADEQNDCPVLK